MGCLRLGRDLEIMLRDKDIICISSIDWDYIWQGHQEIMLALAREGNRVLFVENTGVRAPTWKDLPKVRRKLLHWAKGLGSIRQVEPGLHIQTPLIVPFPYSRLFRRVNRELLVRAVRRRLHHLEMNRPLVWNFLPTRVAHDLIDALNPELLIYYCVDRFEASSPAAQRIVPLEHAMLHRADLVFACSENLAEYCSQYNGNVHLFPFGVSLEKFEKVRDGDTPPPDEFRSISRPFIGFIGGIHRWMDYDLLRALAERNRQWSFVFIGPVLEDLHGLDKLENCHFLGFRQHDELPSFIKAFDVGLIPYVLTPYTENVSPTKINEYLIMGKPVVSTPLPEVLAFNRRHGPIIDVVHDASGFQTIIEKHLTSGQNSREFQRRIVVARGNSWKVRLQAMSALIVKALRDKANVIVKG